MYRLEISSNINVEQWDNLLEACVEHTFFQSKQWVKPWAHQHQLKALCVFTDINDLVLFWPFKGNETTCNFGGIAMSDYNLPIVKTGHEEAIRFAIGEMLKIFDRLQFDEVPIRSTLYKTISSYPKLLERGRKECPSIQLEESDHVAKLFKKKSTKRKRKKLAEVGELRVSHSDEPSEVAQGMEHLSVLHKARWKETPTPSVFENTATLDIFKAISSAGSNLVYSELRVSDEIAAAHLGIAYDSTFIWYMPSYSDKFGHCSPGEILLTEVISHSIERGSKIFDFSRGNESYKYRYSNLVDSNFSLLIYSRWEEYMAHATKTFLKQALTKVLNR